MTLTATYTSRGFEPVAHLFGFTPNPRPYLLTPNTAFSKGDMVVLTAGKVAKAAANATDVLGVMAEAFTTTTNPSASDTYGLVYDDPFQIFRCTFSDHTDSTATGGTTTTLADTALSTSSNDDWNGALLYVYGGTNKGALLTVKDYVGATDTLHFEEAQPAAFDTTSTYIMLGVGSAGDVINIGRPGVDLKDENTIDANAATASNAGPLVMVHTPLEDIKNLMMRVLIRKHLYNTL